MTKAFTLIELLVVVLIISILAAMEQKNKSFAVVLKVQNLLFATQMRI